MIFTELVLQNFGAYADRHIINLRPENNGSASPIILFGGMNGGGKTTLMDAIRLTLYGQRAQCSTRGNLSYSDFLSQSVNQQTLPGEITQIELTFEHIVNDQWKELKIIRAWTRYPQDGKDSLSIMEGDYYDDALANTWDEYIENLLPLGISNLFLFDGEQVKELAELETPPQTVIEAIQSLLGLELAERLAIDLDVLVNRKRKALAKKAQLVSLEEIEHKIKQQQATKEQIKEKLAKLQKELEKAQAKYEQAYDKFRSEGGRIAAKRSQLEEQIKNLTIAAENKRQELRNLATGVLPLALISPLLEQAIVQGEKELKSQQAKLALAIIKERDERLLEYLVTLSLNSHQLEKTKFFLNEENKNLNEEIEDREAPWLSIEEEGLKQLTNLLNNLLPFQFKSARESIKQLQKLEVEIETLETQLARAASPEDYQKLDDAVKKAQQELLNCQTAYAMEQKRCDDIDKEIDRAKKELEKYSEKAFDRANDEHIIQSVAKVQKTLQLFKEKLTLKKLNKLEVEVTECFRYLLHKSNLVHRVAIDSENFRLSLYDPNGQPLPKQRLSAGEKQLLAIAFLWGLARVSGRNLPVAIDTPLGRLDSSHRNNLVERYFPTASHQVILLSTDTEIGKAQVQQLRKQEAIAREYLLKYDPNKRQTTVEEGYFW
ncbi:DNA sulfur modification protein DndD [Pleurocapsales cyanobacterium LEGE 06147]|nr:DNA sulfur modification protein DndD [Pleurocapsales cyanobacterium LEGE 06147]